MADTQSDRRQQAEERRRRILDGSKARLSRIHGRPSDPAAVEDSDAVDTNFSEPLVVQRTPPRVEGATAAAAQSEKFAPRRRSVAETALLERTAAAMYATQRLQLCIAGVVALSQLSTPERTYPFKPRLQLTVILTSWMYFQLTPVRLTQQVQSMRQAAQFGRGAGFGRFLGFLRIVPGLAPLLNSLDDVRLCLRIAYADLAVCVVTSALLQPFDSISEAEL